MLSRLKATPLESSQNFSLLLSEFHSLHFIINIIKSNMKKVCVRSGINLKSFSVIPMLSSI
jgi:hypothetical protein